jgi:hypothetical protein
MRISKSGALGGPSAPELEAISAYARRELTAEEVYTFTVKLCDNEVDRDFERFSTACLEELQPLYVGKSGLMDHAWTAAGQMARIYRTEVVGEPGRTNAAGEPYKYLKGWAYMLRTAETEPLIEAIEGGIVRETSVGCAVKYRTCSICGEEHCAHVPGETYDGQLCHTVLHGASDAYEWSFVAVPAQREAGVLKSKRLRDFVESSRGKGYLPELEALEKRARAGDELLERERREICRLSLLWDEAMAPSVKKAAAHMDVQELMALRQSLEKKLAERFPPVCQLPGRDSEVRFDGEDYLI